MNSNSVRFFSFKWRQDDAHNLFRRSYVVMQKFLEYYLLMKNGFKQSFNWSGDILWVRKEVYTISSYYMFFHNISA